LHLGFIDICLEPKLDREVSVNIYLTFDGNCRAAFEFYRSAIGGEFSAIQSFGDGPPEMKVPDEETDLIMHISFPIGSSVLMGSDSSSAFGPPPIVGNNFSIALDGESKEHCDDLFAKLSADGVVKMPLQEMFWGAYFGTWTDKFGVNWMINYQIPEG
jgi:PhnB protein